MILIRQILKSTSAGLLPRLRSENTTRQRDWEGQSSAPDPVHHRFWKVLPRLWSCLSLFTGIIFNKPKCCLFFTQSLWTQKQNLSFTAQLLVSSCHKTSPSRKSLWRARWKKGDLNLGCSSRSRKKEFYSLATFKKEIRKTAAEILSSPVLFLLVRGADAVPGILPQR